MDSYALLRVRPYQLACMICRLGRMSADELLAGEDRIGQIAQLIRQQPERPLMLVVNIGDVYAWQDPGTEEDTPEGPDFNRKRDLDLLQRMDLAPAAILPARVLLKRLLFCVPTVGGICGYEEITGPAWRGCPHAFSGDYERGAALGLESLIPSRSTEEMQAEKQHSLEALRKADIVRIRPHILLCAICQYANGIRPPFAEDNLPEFLQMILEERDVRVMLVPQADWDMCAPCPWRVPELNACVTGRLSCGGLYNEMKDLEVLQALGLTYGTIMSAREIYRLILQRIPTAKDVCALTKVPVPPYSVWKDACSDNTFPGAYEKGRALLWKAFACPGEPT